MTYILLAQSLTHPPDMTHPPLPGPPSLTPAAQVQHLVSIPDPAPLPDPDLSHPEASRWAAMLQKLDVDGDGAVSRRDMLRAFRRDRQLADYLKMPPRIKVSLRGRGFWVCHSRGWLARLSQKCDGARACRSAFCGMPEDGWK